MEEGGFSVKWLPRDPARVNPFRETQHVGTEHLLRLFVTWDSSRLTGAATRVCSPRTPVTVLCVVLCPFPASP